MEWLEIVAASVDDAKEQALAHLGVDEADAEFEVLSEGKVGLFGRVKAKARVRARVAPTRIRPKHGRSRGQGGSRAGGSRATARQPRGTSEQSGSSGTTSTRSERGPSRRASQPDAPAKRRKALAQKAPAQSASGTGRSQAGAGASSAETGEKGVSQMETSHGGPSLLEQADIAEAFVQGIAERLGLSLTFRRHDLEHDTLGIEANGDGIGLLIGRREATAQAVDELVRTVLQRSGGSIREGKIRIDMAGVRSRRIASLSAFARGVAEEVLESGEEVALESMNRLDRKVVHDAISEIDGVESRSEGEEPNRYILIACRSELG